MQEIITRLKSINVNERLATLRSKLEKETNPRKIDQLVKQIKILENLKDEGLSPEEAFIRNTVPVLPAVFRAPIELPNGVLTTPDVNLLVHDIGIANKALKKAREKNLPLEDINNIKKILRASIEDLSGFDAPTLNPKIMKNPFTTIAGLGSPKRGFFQRKVIRKRQDLTGRSTIIPDAELDIDEIKIPYKMGYKIYDPFIRQELIDKGYSRNEIDKMIISGDDKVKKALRVVGKERPVIINRAPSIRETSVNAMNPIFTDDKALKVSVLLAGLNPSLDFDGDTLAVHVPITNEGIEDAKKLMPSKNLRWEATGKMLTMPEHAAATGLYKLSLKTEGRKQINDILPAEFKVTKATSKSDFADIFKSIDETGKHNTSNIINKLRILGDSFIYEDGFSIGINDLEPIKKIKDPALIRMNLDINRIPAHLRTQNRLMPIYKKYTDNLANNLAEHLKDSDNPLGSMLMSKSRGKPSQFRDLLATPLGTLGGELLDTPIEHSYSEGLDPWEYFNAASGARIGIIGRSQGTALPGALASELLMTANHLVIGDKESKNMKVINVPIEPTIDILDRYIGENVIGAGNAILIKKGDVVTPKVLQIAKKHKKKTLPVYTPLGSSESDGSMPSMAYGIGNDGQLHEAGFNIGVLSANGIVDPLFTSSMGAFHSGGSLQDVASGYPRIKQLLELPKHLPLKAVLSKTDGKISDIINDDLGGHAIIINDMEHYIPASNKINIKKGDKVKKGDPISNGPQDVRELFNLTNLSNVQDYLVNELKKQEPNVRRRNVEAVVETITRHAKIMDPGDSGLLHGDTELISKFEELNEGLKKKIVYEPLFKGVNTLPQAAHGWLSQLGFRNLKRQMKKNVAIGATEDIHGYSPVPALAYGHEFDKGTKGKY